MTRSLAHSGFFAALALAACSSNPKPTTAAPIPTASTGSQAVAPTTATPAPMVMPAPSLAAFNPSRLMATRDSFAAFANGQPLGSAVLALVRDGANFRYTVDIGLSAVNVHQHYESVFDATTLMPVSQSMDGMIQGMTLTSRIAVANGRAKGTEQNPGPTGISTMPVDVAVPPGTVDDQASLALLGTLDLAQGFKTSFMSLGDSPASVRSTDVTVQDKETVTVPAGTFEVYRILVHSKDDAMAFLTTATPHRVVLLRVAGGAVELRLVK